MTTDTRWGAQNSVAIAEGLHRQLERLAAALTDADPATVEVARLAVADARALLVRVRGLRRRIVEATGDDGPRAA